MTSDNVILSDALSLAGSISVALLVIAFLLHKFYFSWSSTNKEGSLLSRMHEELERMSEHNTNLMEQLGKLQIEVIRLNSELFKLTKENQNLHSEVARLTHEVSRLQNLLPGVPDESTN